MGLVLALKGSDDYVHVGMDSQLLAHYGVTAAGGIPVELDEREFYDQDGQPLQITIGDGQVAFAKAGAADVDPPAVLAARVGVVLARARLAFERDPDDELGPIPLVHAPLDVLVAALGAWFSELHPKGQASPPDRGGKIHNWLHSVGLA